MERLGLQIAFDFERFVHARKMPGLEHARLMRTAAYAAVRDTRRLRGEYILQEPRVRTAQDFLRGMGVKRWSRGGVAGLYEERAC
jgi:hypothetical protein